MILSDIETKGKELCVLLNELADALQDRDIPKSYAATIAQFTLRDGYVLNAALFYTLQQREREMPEGYAQ